MKQNDIINNRKKFHEDLFGYLFPRLNRPRSHIDKILYYVDNDNYLQILYTYQIETIRELLSYFLEVEDYNTCAIIRDVVLYHNKAVGTTYKL